MPVPTSPRYPLRSVSHDEMRAFFEAVFGAFGEDIKDDAFEAEMLTAEPDRTLAAFDGDAIVGNAGAYSFDLAVPGGRLPAAGVSFVGVAATHRRRGVLTSMMQRQLRDIHDRGEPVAILWASEAAIYGRYGYGVASRKSDIVIDRVDTRLRTDCPVDDSVSLRLVAADDMPAVITAVEAEVPGRPGSFQRNEKWIASVLVDNEDDRNGYSALRHLVAQRGSQPVGYALYRIKNGELRPYNLADGDAVVWQQQAVTPAVDAMLTRHLLSLDLVRRVRWWNLPLDASLPHLLTDPRQARTTVTDGIHLRVIDVPVALSGRRYVTPLDDVVIELTDPVFAGNTGRWRLRGDREKAFCERTETPADVAMDIETLGAIYLGGISLTSLAAAGRVSRGSADSVREVSAAFAWDVQPMCLNTF
jgi:predicted acetyltransferase